jgi:hypothetical protein
MAGWGGSFLSDTSEASPLEGDMVSEVRRATGIGLDHNVFVKKETDDAQLWIATCTCVRTDLEPRKYETRWVLTREMGDIPEDLLLPAWDRKDVTTRWFGVYVEMPSASLENGVTYRSLDRSKAVFVDAVSGRSASAFFVADETDSRKNEHSRVFLEYHNAVARDAWMVQYESLSLVGEGCVFFSFQEPPVWVVGRSFDPDDPEAVFSVMQLLGFESYALKDGSDRTDLIRFETSSESMELLSDSLYCVPPESPVRSSVSYINFDVSSATSELENKIRNALDGNAYDGQFVTDLKAREVRMDITKGKLYDLGTSLRY